MNYSDFKETGKRGVMHWLNREDQCGVVSNYVADDGDAGDDGDTTDSSTDFSIVHNMLAPASLPPSPHMVYFLSPPPQNCYQR